MTSSFPHIIILAILSLLPFVHLLAPEYTLDLRTRDVHCPVLNTTGGHLIDMTPLSENYILNTTIHEFATFVKICGHIERDHCTPADLGVIMVNRISEYPFSCYYLADNFANENPVELLESDKPWCGAKISYKFGTPGVGFDRVAEVHVLCDPSAEKPRGFHCAPEDCPNADITTIFRFIFKVISKDSCPHGLNVTVPMLQQCAWYNSTLDSEGE